MRRITWIALAGMIFCCPAFAASFDCVKARTNVEKTICANAELSKLDESLASNYKAALQDRVSAEATKQAQKVWLEERDKCVNTDCIKNSYLARNVELGKNADSVSAVKCAEGDVRGHSKIRVEDIVGMYRQSVEGLPAYAFPSEEKQHGYNYLAIEKSDGDRIRVRLSTKEINGHNCGLDSQALLCGKTILLIPSEDENKALTISKQSQPRMRVSPGSIAFTEQADGTVTHGAPYCGQMGYLRHKFLRKTKINVIDETVFLE